MQLKTKAPSATQRRYLEWMAAGQSIFRRSVDWAIQSPQTGAVHDVRSATVTAMLNRGWIESATNSRVVITEAGKAAVTP